MQNYFDEVYKHYTKIWKREPKIYLFDKGPIEKLPSNFRILEFAPSVNRNMWTYATCGMSDFLDNYPIELHLFSNRQDFSITQLLTTVAYYHHNTARLNINQTLNFGTPWQDNSSSDHGLISLPFLDGPKLENMDFEKKNDVVIIKFYWLIPVTKAEVEYKKKFGIEALELKFDEGLNYINPSRQSLV